jgi:hypothetical protein
LFSKHLADETVALTLIIKALGNEAVNVIDLYHQAKAEKIEEKERKNSVGE